MSALYPIRVDLFLEGPVPLVSGIYFQSLRFLISLRFYGVYPGLADLLVIISIRADNEGSGSKDDWNRFAKITGDDGWSWDGIFPYILKVLLKSAFVEWNPDGPNNRMNASPHLRTTTTLPDNSIPHFTRSTVLMRSPCQDSQVP